MRTPSGLDLGEVVNTAFETLEAYLWYKQLFATTLTAVQYLVDDDFTGLQVAKAQRRTKAGGRLIKLNLSKLYM
jgi:hypothetical protein